MDYEAWQRTSTERLAREILAAQQKKRSSACAGCVSCLVMLLVGMVAIMLLSL